ncbi:glutamate-5-semialdehyde dehydrogenase, partial [Prevotella sp. MGM1]
MKSIFTAAKTASRSLALLTDKKRNEVLTDVAAAITECKTEILEANAGDLKKMGRGNPLYDRLLLTPE